MYVKPCATLPPPSARAAMKALTAEITRVDGIYEILYVAYNAAAQQLVGSAEATPNRLYSLTNEVHQLFEFAVLNLVAIEKIMKKHDKK